MIMFFYCIGKVMAQSNEVDKIRFAKSVENTVKGYSGNSKENWSGLISGLIDLVDYNEKGKFSLNATLWSIFNLGDAVSKKENKLPDAQFRTTSFWRNIQINGAITPDPKGKIKFTNGSIGISLAILNNTTANLEDDEYKEINQILSKGKINEALRIYRAQYLKDPNRFNSEIPIINKVYNDPDHDVAKFPKEFIQFCSDEYKCKELTKLHDTLFVSDKVIENAVKNILAFKPLWKISISKYEDIIKPVNSALTFATNLLLPVGADEPIASLDIGLSYKMMKDTMKTMTSIGDRQIIKASFGSNFKINPVFEIKIALSYDHIAKCIYLKEKESVFKASLTPRIKLSEHIWFPITIKYDINNANFLGFLTVQYSME